MAAGIMSRNTGFIIARFRSIPLAIVVDTFKGNNHIEMVKETSMASVCTYFFYSQSGHHLQCIEVGKLWAG